MRRRIHYKFHWALDLLLFLERGERGGFIALSVQSKAIAFISERERSTERENTARPPTTSARGTRLTRHFDNLQITISDNVAKMSIY